MHFATVLIFFHVYSMYRYLIHCIYRRYVHTGFCIVRNWLMAGIFIHMHLEDVFNFFYVYSTHIYFAWRPNKSYLYWWTYCSSIYLIKLLPSHYYLLNTVICVSISEASSVLNYMPVMHRISAFIYVKNNTFFHPIKFIKHIDYEYIWTSWALLHVSMILFRGFFFNHQVIHVR